MEVGQVVVDSIARFCSNLPRAILAMEVLGPPDSSGASGSPAGRSFRARFCPVYVGPSALGADTDGGRLTCAARVPHPGGSVIGINGRNAAMEALRDVGSRG